MSDRTLALDIDGVLNSHEWFVKMGADELERRPIHNMIDPTCVARLNRLVTVSGAQVVLSSAWRIAHHIDDVRAALAHRGYTGTLVGQTPRYLRCRGEEIQTWLNAAGRSADHLVILDDDSDMAHLLPCLVKTSWSVGLTDADVDRALALFESAGFFEALGVEAHAGVQVVKASGC